jgi:hypothetical protein
MRLPRVRFTILSMMIAVAVVGTVLGSIMERRARFLRLAEYHGSQVVGVSGAIAVGSEVWWDAQGNPLSPEQIERDRWHLHLWSKYSLAARHPWLPVDSDPPEP